MDEKLREIIDNSKRLVFFSGAGVSTESGIPDFRSNKGLYKTEYKYPPEIIVSHKFFLKHTEEFFEFYKSKMLHPDAKPNTVHYSLAELEQEGRLKAVITQNIDGLFQMAGVKNVIELHGSVMRNHCVDCGAEYGVDKVAGADGIPRCVCGGIIKPDVVLYDENLNERDVIEAIKYIRHADTLIVGGTSLVVYPAAGLLNYFRGRTMVLINKTETPYDSMADYVYHDNIAKVMGK